MMWDLPTSVEINGEQFNIRNKCDYRVILDCIYALQDADLPQREQVRCALFIFYEDSENIKDIEEAVRQMMLIINNGKEEKEETAKPILMDWQKDFPVLAPPISRVLGYSVRSPEKFTHWYDFIGAYLEIGSECVFSNITTIRSKLQKGKPLEKYEEEFYRENRDLVNLPRSLSEEEEMWLFSE